MIYYHHLASIESWWNSWLHQCGPSRALEAFSPRYQDPGSERSRYQTLVIRDKSLTMRSHWELGIYIYNIHLSSFVRILGTPKVKSWLSLFSLPLLRHTLHQSQTNHLSIHPSIYLPIWQKEGSDQTYPENCMKKGLCGCEIYWKGMKRDLLIVTKWYQVKFLFFANEVKSEKTAQSKTVPFPSAWISSVCLFPLTFYWQAL